MTRSLDDWRDGHSPQRQERPATDDDRNGLVARLERAETAIYAAVEKVAADDISALFKAARGMLERDGERLVGDVAYWRERAKDQAARREAAEASAARMRAAWEPFADKKKWFHDPDQQVWCVPVTYGQLTRLHDALASASAPAPDAGKVMEDRIMAFILELEPMADDGGWLKLIVNRIQNGDHLRSATVPATGELE